MRNVYFGHTHSPLEHYQCAGPLARHRGMASRRGSFTDTVGDQVVVAATTITWMVAGAMQSTELPGVGIVSGSVYLVLYTVVVVFAMVRNAMGIPYAWVLRPRNFVYAWFVLELYVFVGTSLSGSIEYVIWLFNAMLATKFITAFFHIRAEL